MAKILIIDDSPSEVHIVTGILEKDGYQIISASSGADGIALAATELPDLILMDLVMPGMNGFQAIRKIRRNDSTKNIPIIIVTTKKEETDIEWGLKQGASAYVTKPVDAESFREKVKELCSS